VITTSASPPSVPPLCESAAKLESLSRSVNAREPPVRSNDPTEAMLRTESSPWSCRTAAWSSSMQTWSVAFGTRTGFQLSGDAQLESSASFPVHVIVHGAAAAADGAIDAPAPAMPKQSAIAASAARRAVNLVVLRPQSSPG
jgi:hypothetical protein